MQQLLESVNFYSTAGNRFSGSASKLAAATAYPTLSIMQEWGDPRKKEFYFYMKSFSPVDNVKAQIYPNILVTAGLNDPCVMYLEPAKFMAKLRDMKTDDNMFKYEFGAGHSSKSGRFEKLQEDAFTYTFILKALNMIPASTSGQN